MNYTTLEMHFDPPPPSLSSPPSLVMHIDVFKMKIDDNYVR